MAQTLIWGAGDLGLLADTRYLPIGPSQASATTVRLGYREVIDSQTIRNMRVLHCSPTQFPAVISYRIRVNGVDSALIVNLPGNQTDGSNLTEEVDVQAGDLVEVVAVKNTIIMSGLVRCSVSAEFF